MSATVTRIRQSNARRTRSRSNLGRAVTAGLEALENRQMLAGNVFATVINDVNANGAKDVGDDVIAGVTVFVDMDSSGTLDAGEPSGVTHIDGEIKILNVPNGKEDVKAILPDGWGPTPGTSDVIRVNFRNGETAEIFYFAVPASPYGTVTGTVWNDIGRDGVRDASDPGIPGWTVFADLNTNRIKDAGEPFAITDGAGQYTIPNLLPGQYKIREITPSGWDPTIGADGANTVDVSAGHTSVSDFGNYNVASLGSIQGTVWNDVNADSVRAAGDPGLGGWTVYMDLNADGGLSAGEPSALTDASAD
jgi:hypothetical protein